MKLLFSILICVPLSSFGSQVRIYFKDTSLIENAKHIRRILESNYSLPKYLIKTQFNQNCEPRDSRFLEICIEANGQVWKLNNKNHKRILNSLLEFSNDEVFYEY